MSTVRDAQTEKARADHWHKLHTKLGTKLQHKSIALRKAEALIVDLKSEITALRETK